MFTDEKRNLCFLMLPVVFSKGGRHHKQTGSGDTSAFIDTINKVSFNIIFKKKKERSYADSQFLARIVVYRHKYSDLKLIFGIIRKESVLKGETPHLVFSLHM